jgi:HCOMODA/2-hydroxy-3-carboxy-muconic semialdehyde decarboxylase
MTHLTDAPSETIEELVAANHILAFHGVVDGFGHVSMRHPARPDRYLLTRNKAPELVESGDILELDLDSNIVSPGEHRSFLERFLHGELYRARPDIMAVVHSHSPSQIPFGVTTAPLRAVSHMGAFLGTGAPVFEIRDVRGDGTDLLVRDPELARALADSLGDQPVVLMRGHGSTVVGASLRQTVFRAVYAEFNARMQTQALQIGGPVTYLTEAEGAAAAATNDSQIDRAWKLWLHQAHGR